MLFVIGASGAGKTAAVQALEQRTLSGVRCYYFDSVGVPTPEEMEKDWGGGEQWQAETTKRWIEKLASNCERAEVVVLEGQTRPSFILPAAESRGLRHYRILLLDCAPSIRTARLRGPRAQPELSNDQMDAWAAYLRGQADALGLPVVNTSSLSIAEVATVLQEQIDRLRVR